VRIEVLLYSCCCFATCSLLFHLSAPALNLRLNTSFVHAVCNVTWQLVRVSHGQYMGIILAVLLSDFLFSQSCYPIFCVLPLL
jgi:hypothetical protein